MYFQKCFRAIKTKKNEVIPHIITLLSCIGNYFGLREIIRRLEDMDSKRARDIAVAANPNASGIVITIAGSNQTTKQAGSLSTEIGSTPCSVST